MRIRKDPEIRRTELIDAALALFGSAGYEKTMIVDIVKKAGVAKGTFYYYFPTKEAVLTAICSRWATEMTAAFQAKSRRFTAREKLCEFIRQQFLPGPLDAVFDHLWSEKQFDLFFRIWQQQVEAVFNPLLAGMIRQGNREGSMRVACIDETLVFFWSTLNCLWDAIYLKEAAAVLDAKASVAEAILTRILGMEEGALRLPFVRQS